jgi:hypothetical protein
VGSIQCDERKPTTQRNCCRGKKGEATLGQQPLVSRVSSKWEDQVIIWWINDQTQNMQAPSKYYYIYLLFKSKKTAGAGYCIMKRGLLSSVVEVERLHGASSGERFPGCITT